MNLIELVVPIVATIIIHTRVYTNRGANWKDHQNNYFEFSILKFQYQWWLMVYSNWKLYWWCIKSENCIVTNEPNGMQLQQMNCQINCAGWKKAWRQQKMFAFSHVLQYFLLTLYKSYHCFKKELETIPYDYGENNIFEHEPQKLHLFMSWHKLHTHAGWFIDQKPKKEIESYHALSHNMEMSMRNCEFFIWWILTELDKWCCISISIHAAQHTQTTNKLRPSEPISVNNRSDLHQIINENVLNPDGGNAIKLYFVKIMLIVRCASKWNIWTT